MTLARGVTLVAAVVLMGFVPARIDSRLFVFAGVAVVIYANFLMLGYSPLMGKRLVIAATLLQGTGLGMLLPSLSKTAFGTLDPKFRPDGTAFFNLCRVYGSTIGIAVVQIFFYDNTQAMHLGLAKNLAPYRAAAHVAGSIDKAALAALNEMVTQQAATVAIIDQFKILMLAMLVVSPLVFLLRAPRPVG
jgi:DHA2 family multidrug resistance protein